MIKFILWLRDISWLSLITLSLVVAATILALVNPQMHTLAQILALGSIATAVLKIKE
jgi:hypothetical protein